MEKDICVIDSTEERAAYIAEALVTRSLLARDDQVNEQLPATELIRLEIAESGWNNITERNVEDVMETVAIQVGATNMENWVICTYARLNRDFGIKYESDIDPSAAIDDVDEEAMEVAMSLEEVVDFCRSAKRGDRCRFLNLDRDEVDTAAEIMEALHQEGVRVSLLAQEEAQIGDYFVIVVLGEDNGASHSSHL